MTTLDASQIQAAANALHDAETARRQIAAVTQSFPQMDMDDAYAVQSGQLVAVDDVLPCPRGEQQPGVWEVAGYHNRGDPWREQRYWND